MTKRIRPDTEEPMNCQICSQAPVTRRIRYNGMAGLILACNKKMHDLSAKDRRGAKDAHSGKMKAHARMEKLNPFATGAAPRMASYIKNAFKSMKFALTRRDQSR